MTVVGISEPSRTAPGWAPFALAFRPFFLLAGASAVVLVALWGAAFASGALVTNYYGFIGWHSHEMLFGYSSAVVAGFLLTAARNWTSMNTLRGVPLALLALLWLLGRLLPFVPGLPPLVIAVVDMAFLPTFALALAIPLLRAGHYKSLLFVAMALGIACSNLLVHLELLGLGHSTAHSGIYLAVSLFVLAIVIMGGRVIPFFTEKGVPGFVRREWRAIERLAPLTVLAAATVELLGAPYWLLAAMAVTVVMVNGWRLAGWYSAGIWRVPLLWVLHLGYAWIVLGFALKALAAFDLFPPLLALHALTVGGIGGVTLGMMARVSLGHTGRTLTPPAGMGWAFALIYAATLVRVFAPLLSQAYATLVVLSAVLWSLAFLLFVFNYAPMLLRPRLDGQPG